MSFLADGWATKVGLLECSAGCALFAGRSPARPAPIRVSRGPSPELSRIGVVSGPGVRSRVVMGKDVAPGSRGGERSSVSLPGAARAAAPGSLRGAA